MRYLYSLIACISIFTYLSADYVFTFVNNKDKQGALKIAFLKQIAEIFHVDTFVETGTYMGQTAANAATIFKAVYTVELHPAIYAQAKNFLSRYTNVNVYHGNSADVLRTILPTIDGKIVLWLDAHYCG